MKTAEQMKLFRILACESHGAHGARECFKGISKRMITMTQKYAWMHDFELDQCFDAFVLFFTFGRSFLRWNQNIP